jgi:hypothetical protein
VYDDDSAGAELRRLMLTADVPASGADLRRAIADGQRAARRRAALAAGATGIAVLAAAGAFAALGPARTGSGQSPALPPPSTAPAAASGAAAGCRPTALALPAGGNAEVAAMDPAGRIFAGTTGPDRDRPVRWKDGKAEALAGVSGAVMDVGADGAVLGNAEGAGGWVWRDGHVTHLAKLQGYTAMFPMAINATGAVAGYAVGGSLDDAVPVTWSADGAVHKLALPGKTNSGTVRYSMARDIADDGTVVGDFHGAPVIWTPDGVPRALGAVTGDALVWAIAGHYVYGWAGGEALRWDLDAQTVTTLVKGGDSGARAGSAGGDALLPGNLPATSKRVTKSGRVDELTGPGGEPATALAMSTDGTTVAGVVAAAVPYPAVWHCT